MPPSAATYARLAFSILAKHGLWALLAVFLVWKVVESNESTLQANSIKLQELTEGQAAHSADTKRQIDLLRAICLGVNTTEQARAMCEVSR